MVDHLVVNMYQIIAVCYQDLNCYQNHQSISCALWGVQNHQNTHSHRWRSSTKHSFKKGMYYEIFLSKVVKLQYKDYLPLRGFTIEVKFEIYESQE